MPLSPVSGPGGGGNFNGGVVTGQVTLSESNKDTAALQLKPSAGATADATNQLELYDDLGNQLGWWDAAGNFSTGSSPSTAKYMQWDSAGGLAVGSAASQVVGSLFGSDDQLRFDLRLEAAPLDADVLARHVTLWFDSTNGASKLMIKGKSANGTLVTGSVALS